MDNLKYPPATRTQLLSVLFVLGYTAMVFNTVCVNCVAQDGSFLLMLWQDISRMGSITCGAYKVPLFVQAALKSVFFHNFWSGIFLEMRPNACGRPR